MINTDDEILDYGTCKLLKEVGFDEPCELLYETAIRHNGEDLSFDEEMELKSEGRDGEIEYTEGGWVTSMYNRNSDESMSQCGCVSAPDIYTVIRWLRKKRDVNIKVGYDSTTHKWYWLSANCSDGCFCPYNGTAESYEAAAKDAIASIIENRLS